MRHVAVHAQLIIMVVLHDLFKPLWTGWIRLVAANAKLVVRLFDSDPEILNMSLARTVTRLTRKSFMLELREDFQLLRMAFPARLLSRKRRIHHRILLKGVASIPSVVSERRRSQNVSRSQIRDENPRCQKDQSDDLRWQFGWAHMLNETRVSVLER